MKKVTGFAWWGAFALCNGLTWVAYIRLWMRPDYTLILGGAGAITVVVAAALLLASRNRHRDMLLIVIGLLIGQWWLMETWLLRGAWSVH